MNARKAQADLYIRKPAQWGEAMARLRAILRDGELEEKPALSEAFDSLTPGRCR